MPLDAKSRYDKQTATIDGREMAYIDVGQGDPIVFLHGNPTSSYLWRNVMPHLEGQGRLIAPDLIGMGDSDPLPQSGPDRYRFVEHRQYLDGLLAHLGVAHNVVLVIHDWGSGLGFHWAHRHPDAVQGIAYMEAIVRPMAWTDWPEAAREVFQGFRSPAGEKMVLDKNVFVERVLPGSVLRDLTDEEMAEYRRPFTEAGERRRPTLTWPRELPLEGAPADVVQIVADYGAWLASDASPPKLMINAEPGAIMRGPQLDFARTFTRQEEVTVKGLHFVQEDSPDEIGQAASAFVRSLRPAG